MADHSSLYQEVTLRVQKAMQLGAPSGIVIPDALIPDIRQLDDFIAKLGQSDKDPLIGWFQGLPVYRSFGRDEILIF